MIANDDLPAERDDSRQGTINELRMKVAELEQVVVATNDAACGLSGILFRVAVDSGLISREALSDAIEARAGSIGSDDHNPILLAFARAIRMNFPGGRFEVIEGGQSQKSDGD
ncbi:hypothetical protein [Sphingobium nicotianae]|uniref:Uncharacterized protein n=1 Tax=Sphingobium nicotianae TaxID=2782607 RepID=A0A9X1DBZ5_9SPHN|nr:hypothetical protein [Sphingobium nicotianae]MBT2187207.1 hypothetical protein [Sphingobium nicotianae]